MSFQANFAAWAGDIWVPRDENGKGIWALFPKPAVISGIPHFKIDSDDYRCFTALAKPGDMAVMTGLVWDLTNRGIKSTSFKHLAVYTGAVEAYRDQKTGFLLQPKSMGVDYKPRGKVKNNKWKRTFTHAVSEGIMTQDMLEVVFHYMDYVAFVRPWKTKQQQQAIVDFAIENNGMGYNFDFTPDGPKALYCTELGARCCEEAGIAPPEKIPLNVSWKGLIPGLTKKYQYPVYLADYFVKTYPVIACSKSCVEVSTFVNKSPIADELRLALKQAPNFNTMGEVDASA